MRNRSSSAERRVRSRSSWRGLLPASGLAMEFLAHRVKQIAAPHTEIPVELTAVEVGPSKHGREMISIDISEYGDPLYSRAVRVPFSVYLKPWQQAWAFKVDTLAKLQPIFVIPLQGIDWRAGNFRDARSAIDGEVAARAIEQNSRRYSRHWQKCCTITRDRSSQNFMNEFYSQEQHPPELWPETYDRQPLEILPACARVALEMPNDLLLRPAFIRRLVRVMLALGWHPRHIAGLICSKYQSRFRLDAIRQCRSCHARRFLHACFRRPFRCRHGRSSRFQLRFGSGARHVHIVKLRIQSAEF